MQEHRRCLSCARCATPVLQHNTLFRHNDCFHLTCLLQQNEGVAVRWDDGWYNGVLINIRGGDKITFQVQYEDGNLYKYTTATPPTEKVLFCTDTDGDTHTVYRCIPSYLGGAGAVIYKDDQVTRISSPTGAVSSSFDSEIFAATKAFFLSLLRKFLS